MSMKLADEVKTATDLEQHPRAILDRVVQTGRSVLVTQEGKPAVVILNAAAYERKLQAINLALLLAPAEADVRAGRTRPIEEFFDELDREMQGGQKVSG